MTVSKRESGGISAERGSSIAGTHWQLRRWWGVPRFYMHVCNGNGFVEDDEGVELPDMDVARAKAIEAARDLMASELRAGELDLASFIEVEDENHALLFTLHFSDAVTLTNLQRR